MADHNNIPGLDTEDINYLAELFRSSAVFNGGMVTVLVTAGMTFFAPLGLALVPLLVGAGGLGVAALFVPESPVFRHFVERKKARERRGKVREFLLAKIEELRYTVVSNGSYNRERSSEYVPEAEFDRLMANNKAMQTQLASMREMAEDATSAMTLDDVDKLEETILDHLRSIHARLVLHQRINQGSAALQTQLNGVEQQLRDNRTSIADRRALEQVRDDLSRLIAQRARLPAKLVTLQAKIATMSEAFADLYHRAMDNPSSKMSDYITEASHKLTFEDDFISSLDADLDALERAKARKAAEGSVDDVALDTALKDVNVMPSQRTNPQAVVIPRPSKKPATTRE